MDTRKVSFDILKKIETENVYVGEVLDGALRTMQFSDKRDRAFITRIVEGVVERRISLDFLIDKFSKKPLGKNENSDKKKKNSDIDIQIVLRMGIYQIKYMDSVPDRAAISECVSLVKTLGYHGLTGYVNGLLRNVARAKDEKKLDSYLVSRMDVRYSTPKWLCDFLIEAYGKETAKLILEDQYKEHDTVVRINTLKTDRKALTELFEDKGIEVKEGVLSERCLRIKGYDSVRRLPGYREGMFVVQDETSVYTIEHIGIKPGDKVLDICAAPGGKSLLAYELTVDSDKAGTIVARDISDGKLERILENAERLEVPVQFSKEYQLGVNLEISDATSLDLDIVNLPDSDKYDVVIADVPCSGLGIIGRKNDIKYHMTPEIIDDLSKQGLKILLNASQYVKKGGRICYSTCTINPKENSDVVKKFLEDEIKSIDKEAYFSVLEEKQFLQGIDGSDGFYFCVLQRG